ncbi:MAG: hypothetical protein HY842_19635 [Bacteroidetes bacterium]|nr:hypothetical protein [Bacteroidota bacterium]
MEQDAAFHHWAKFAKKQPNPAGVSQRPFPANERRFPATECHTFFAKRIPAAAVRRFYQNPKSGGQAKYFCPKD